MAYVSGRTRRGPIPRLIASFHRLTLVNWLRLIWITSILWYELGMYRVSLALCDWPDEYLPKQAERPAHVLLVSDPQIHYIPASRRSLTARLRNNFYEITLKKNWNTAMRTNPDVVFFLGDMLNSVRLVRTDDEYESQYHKFMNIFSIPQGVEAYYLPGNSDVGLNVDLAYSLQARRRYLAHFGPLNQQVSIRNHTFVLLDASGLVEEDYQRAARNIEYNEWTPIQGGPVEFIRSLSEQRFPSPILLTHIPLYRRDAASCGLLREQGNIHRGVGPGYQNILGKKTTTFLLQTIQPSIVFSGDDRDYCEYMHVASRSFDHQYPPDVREVTVKSFSPYQAVRRPGFQLLSVISPPPPTLVDPTVPMRSYLDRPCLLPSYIDVYTTHYLPLLVVCTLLLAYARLRSYRRPTLPITTDPLPSSPLSSPGDQSLCASPGAHRPSFPSSATKRDFGPQGGLRTPRTPHISVTAIDGNGAEAAMPTFRASLVGSAQEFSPTPDEDDIACSPSYALLTEESGQWVGNGYVSPTPFSLYHQHQDEESPAHSDSLEQDAFVRRQGPLANVAAGGSSSYLPGPLRQLRWWFFTSGKRELATRRKRRMIAFGTAFDLCLVMWPSVLLWYILTWWG